ncbi:MAG TPA: hypothetical protein VOA41_21395 [Candidatus Dormibacteraeota bacterium]|nr:hypothetical protein [Candidatus Dormibacteraeota bacterium]
MIEERNHDVEVREIRSGTPGWVLPVIVLLALVATAGLVLGWRATNQLEAARQATTSELKTVRTGVDQDFTTVRDRIAADEKANTALQSDLAVVTKKLRITQGQLKTARQEATKLQEENTQKITALDTSVKSELSTKASNEDLKTTKGLVTDVKTDLDTTKKDLQMVRSEFGTLIARNHEDIDTLRRMGERDYIEFTVSGKNKSQKVGNVIVELRNVNEKKNKYTVKLTVEDKVYEKKDRSLNEPIFFFVQGARQPEEIVINKASKNSITGYVSIPKMNVQQATGTGSSGQ